MCRRCRAVFYSILLVFLTNHLPAAEVLSAAAATNQVGEQVIVKLVIRSGGRNGEYQELYNTSNWQDDGCLILRFSPTARGSIMSERPFL